MGEEQREEHRALHRRQHLRDEEQPAAIDAVHEHAREEAEDEPRQRLRGGEDAHVPRRLREVHDEPRLREHLDHVAHLRHHEARPQQPEVAVGEGLPELGAHARAA